MSKTKVVIIGSGNIGTDLMFKIERSKYLEIGLIAGIDPDSKGLALAKERGHRITTKGIKGFQESPDLGEIVIDATSAKAHFAHAPILQAMGKMTLDLTPAKIGKMIVPVVNLHELTPEIKNISLITCGAQATIPIVAAISKVVDVEYAEIVSTISSKSAGPGTRQNIDEFTQSTSDGLVKVGKAQKGKAIIILNPAEPPIMMRDTIYTVISDKDEVNKALITDSIHSMVEKVQSYVPGYELDAEPIFDGAKITTLISVQGAGDFLPPYSGNLDIITSAAVATAELLAGKAANG